MNGRPAVREKKGKLKMFAFVGLAQNNDKSRRRNS